RCDRKVPCGACARHDVTCVFNPSASPGHRRKRPTNQILTDRLRYYESLLLEKGVTENELQRGPGSEGGYRSLRSFSGISNDSHPRSGRPIGERESGQPVNQAQTIHCSGSVIVVDKYGTEYSQDALGDYPDDESHTEISDDDFGFVLDGHTRSKTKLCHPAPNEIHQLWKIFVNNVDPLTKIIHVPTVQPMIEKVASKAGALPRGFEALIFSIYSAAVMSLSDDECNQRLNESRNVLMSRHIAATKAALSMAKFMGTTSLVVLQALVIHLIAVRDVYEQRAIWSLTGVAVRIAQSMGLDRDGDYLGLPIFESEIRRRIWWQLKIHDFRTAELCGVGKFHDLRTGENCTKWPSNVSDDKLLPDMSALPTEPAHLTDMVFISLKCDLLNYAAGRAADLRRQGKASIPWDPRTPVGDLSEADRSVRGIEEELETKYLRYCDPSQPLHLMAMLVARCSISMILFMSHHPRRWSARGKIPSSELDLVWGLCMKLLEHQNMLQSNALLKQFAWHAPYFQQWHAIIHILDTLRTNPLHSGAERAWKIIHATYENNLEMTFDLRKPIHVAVAHLCVRAYDNRESALQRSDIQPSTTPGFVGQLRQQLRALQKSTQRDDATQYAIDGLIRDGQAITQGSDHAKTDENTSNPGHHMNTLNVDHTGEGMSPGEEPSADTAVFQERDSLPFTYGHYYDQVNDANGADMGFGLISSSNYGMDNSFEDQITWEQWDYWLSQSNLGQGS
ncbi:mitogen-activated protein kinase, partial [Lipomyces kononenkoae]